MEKTYRPESFEQHWYQVWDKAGLFQPNGQGNPYCIMLPPPNVTGSLHMGHAFQYVLMDILIRYHRMRGDNTLWQCGTDHAGIATQMVVERQLIGLGKTRHDLGRDNFTDSVWRWKEKSGDTIIRQARRLGTSMDWSRQRFTLDDGLSQAVQNVFIQLYDEGLIYRGKRLVNWDPVLLTAISDLEVNTTEEQGSLWHIRYPFVDGNGYLTVATTRPETLLGDAAVAVNPDDERYRHLIGAKLTLPLTDRTIPVIADEHVDPAFGSGCVKITPAHDFNDYAVGQRHSLPLLNIFTPDAHINDNAPAAYRGLDRYTAREQIIADLQAQQLIEKIDKHTLMIPRGDRSGAVIEPYLTNQWFVKTQPLAAPAIRAVEQGKIRFIPDNWSKTYFDWMHRIEDWCISRQLWWGHRIPAWYDENGNSYVGRNETDIREKYQLGDEVRLSQDEDVLDTWFSAALWPFSTLGWPQQTDDLKTFFPTNVLVTGFDIIFFWVARMIMMGIKFTGDVPFREIYIHGLIRDTEGQKMSKSKGNVLDPIDLIDGISLEALIEKRTSNLMQPQLAAKIEQSTRRQFPKGIASYGTDALRFTFAALATTGRDINFDSGRIGGYRNFCNKLWNATRFVLHQVETHSYSANNRSTIELGLTERWITSRLKKTIEDVSREIDHYRFDLAAQALYEFAWNEYCDWYLEFAKITLNSPTAGEAARCRTLHTLITVLESLLRLMHPFMPFITEELWQRVSPKLNIKADSIMGQPYPNGEKLLSDSRALQTVEWLQTFVLSVRSIRSKRNLPPGKNLPILVQGGTAEERIWLSATENYIKTLCRADAITVVNKAPNDTALALAGTMTVLIPLAELIDPAEEKEKLRKEIDNCQKQYQQIRTKLANQAFLDKAPPDIVRKEQQRLEAVTAKLQKLEAQMDSNGTLA